MKHKEFDDIIRGKLNGFEADFDPQAWELFEEVQANHDSGTPELDNNAIDEVVFDRLHQFEVPFQPAHWQKMNQRLKEEFSLQYKIYRYKLVEISVVLLAVFTIINLWPSIGAFPIQFGGKQSLETNTPKDQIQQHINKASIPLEKENVILSIPVAPKKTGPIASTLEITPSTTEFSNLDNTEKLENTSTIAKINPSTTFDVTPVIPTKKIDKVYSDPYNLYNKWEYLATAQKLPTLNLLHSQFVEVDHNLPSINKEKEKATWRVGMFGSSNLVNVKTPANFVNDSKIAGFRRNGIGYGGGISVGISKNRWEFELGMMYNAMKYAPTVAEVQGNVKLVGSLAFKSLKVVELNMISVPLNIRYNYLHNKKWRSYILGGISAHVSAQSNYDIGDDPTELIRGGNSGRSDDEDTLSSNGSSQGNEEDIPLLYDPENLTKGWLEGGTFKENAYFSGSIGLGVEYFFNDKWSVFTQPTYLHSFRYLNGGLGPNKDRLNSINVLMGIKVNLID